MVWSIYNHHKSVESIGKGHSGRWVGEEATKESTKTWRSTVVAIRKAKDLNKISLDEIYGSLLTYKKKVNEIEKEEKNKAIDKKKSLGLKMSSH